MLSVTDHSRVEERSTLTDELLAFASAPSNKSARRKDHQNQPKDETPGANGNCRRAAITSLKNVMVRCEFGLQEARPIGRPSGRPGRESVHQASSPASSTCPRRDVRQLRRSRRQQHQCPPPWRNLSRVGQHSPRRSTTHPSPHLLAVHAQPGTQSLVEMQ